MAKKLNKDEIMDLLACPICKADLKRNKEENTLTCTKCGEIYAIEDGIPILLPKKE